MSACACLCVFVSVRVQEAKTTNAAKISEKFGWLFFKVGMYLKRSRCLFVSLIEMCICWGGGCGVGRGGGARGGAGWGGGD
jgi:hypothetical protein